MEIDVIGGSATTVVRDVANVVTRVGLLDETDDERSVRLEAHARDARETLAVLRPAHGDPRRRHVAA